MLCANACGFILFPMGWNSSTLGRLVMYTCYDKNRPMWVGTEPTSGLECTGHCTNMAGGADENRQVNSRL